MTLENALIIASIAIVSFIAGLLVGHKLFGRLAYRDGKYDQETGTNFHRYWEL